MLAPLFLLCAGLAAEPRAVDAEIASGIRMLERLEYDRAVVVLGRALTRDALSPDDRRAGMEALGFAYAILDDGVHADETFCALLDFDPAYKVAASRSPRLRDAFARAHAAWTRGRRVSFSLDPDAVDLAGQLSGDPRRVGSVIARSEEEAVTLACEAADCRGARPRGQFRVEVLDHRGTILATAGPFAGEARGGPLPWWGWVAIGVGAVGVSALVAAAASPGDPPAGSLGSLQLP